MPYGALSTVISFQEGNPGTAGVNGLCNEALLAVVIDRLRCFQAGPFPCEKNAWALVHLERGLSVLKHRTLALVLE